MSFIKLIDKVKRYDPTPSRFKVGILLILNFKEVGVVPVYVWDLRRVK